MIKRRDFIIIISLIVLALAVIKLKAFDFSGYRINSPVDQCFMAKSEGGVIYIVDEGHERISAVDEEGEVIYSIEGPDDGTETAWYIDDFTVDNDGSLYLSCTEWDGFYLAKEAILKYDSTGKFVEDVFFREYAKNSTNKHRIMGIHSDEGLLSFAFLNENSILITELLNGEEQKTKPLAFVNAYTEISDVAYSEKDGTFYALSRRGKIFALETGDTVFDIEGTIERGGAPYRFSVSKDGAFLIADIKDRTVYSYSEETGLVPVIEDTDTLTAFSDENRIFTADYGNVYISEKTDSSSYEITNTINSRHLSLTASLLCIAKLVLLLLFVIVSIIFCVRLFAIVRASRISFAFKVEAEILALASIIIFILLFMMLKQFKSGYRENLFSQMSMTAYSIASEIEAEDIDNVNFASDFCNDSYERILAGMDKFFFKDLSLSNQMYCNILKWDGDEKPAYAIAYYDRSIGTYYPLDEEESAEVIKVYQTGSAVLNEGKEDVAGTFLYIKIPVFREDNSVGGVVSVGMDTYIMDSLVKEMRNRTLLSIAPILLLALIAGLEIMAVTNAKSRYIAISKEEPGRRVLPVYLIRILVFFVFVAYNMSTSFLPVYVLNHSDVKLPFGKELVASLPITVNLLVLGVMSLFCSRIVRKIGIKKLLLLSGLSSFAGNITILLIPSYYAIFTGLILDGIGVGLMINAVYIIITYVKHENDRADAFATYNAGCISGINFGTMLGAVLAVNIGQKNVFLVVAMIWLFVIFLGILVFRKANNLLSEEGKEPNAGSGGEKHVGILLKDKLSMSFFFLIQNPYIVFNSFVFFFVPIFCDENGYNETMASVLLMVYSMFAVYLSNILTKVTLEIFKFRAMYIALAMNIAAVWIFALTQNMWGLVGALLILGVSAAFGKSVQQTFFCELKAAKEYGEDNAMGIYNFSENVGESLGPIVFSYVMGAAAIRVAVSVFCGVVTLLGGIHFGITKGCKQTAGEE